MFWPLTKPSSSLVPLMTEFIEARLEQAIASAIGMWRSFNLAILCRPWMGSAARNRLFADSSLEETVRSELVSDVRISLLAGKIQGNSSILPSEIPNLSSKARLEQKTYKQI